MVTNRRPRSRRVMGVAGSVLTIAALVSACADGGDTASSTSTGAAEPTTSTSSGSSTSSAEIGASWPVTDLVLDVDANYGDEYADGILPVGDGLVVTDGPQKGYVYLCNEGGEGGGASQRGPWFVNNNTEYDINAKIAVEGEVEWEGAYVVSLDGDERVISTNAVPDDHPTGQFPVAPGDPAYEYDRNPNSIEEQTLDYRLAALPALLEEPACMGGEAGVMVTGVGLFNAFDAGNRDAGAWETQDGCDGHPEITGQYHYHTLSSCIDDIGVSTVIGFALDGFPITGPMIDDGNILTTDDLDECHGITSTVEIDGEQVETYHYVMTQDFPYSVSCFRATPSDPPGDGAGGRPGDRSVPGGIPG